jgi:hypothetical protein
MKDEVRKTRRIDEEEEEEGRIEDGRQRGEGEGRSGEVSAAESCWRLARRESAWFSPRGMRGQPA